MFEGLEKLADHGFPVVRYDQLGCGRSDRPDEPDLWVAETFYEEIRVVRAHLGLDLIHLLGHSWGGILAMEYALKYQQHIKGLVISNMMASIPAYNDYARKTLLPAMDPAVLAEIDRFEATGKTDDPRYMELLMPHHYEKHVLRMPAAAWPDPVKRAVLKHLNLSIYVPMQGPSELRASGKLAAWDRTADLGKIAVPTLTIGAGHDTMDPAHMEMMAGRVQKGRYLFCPNGSHLAIYDDQKTYMDGVLRFIRDVDRGAFRAGR